MPKDKVEHKCAHCGGIFQDGGVVSLVKGEYALHRILPECQLFAETDLMDCMTLYARNNLLVVLDEQKLINFNGEFYKIDIVSGLMERGMPVSIHYNKPKTGHLIFAEGLEDISSMSDYKFR